MLNQFLVESSSSSFAKNFADHCENDEIFDMPIKELSLLYMSLSHCFKNIMFGFKINFNIFQYLEPFGYIYDQINNIIDYKLLFNDSESSIVDKCLKHENNDCDCRFQKWVYEYDNQLLFSFIIKSKNISKNNQSCQSSHMEPKYKCECHYCKPKPWLDF